MNKRKMKWHIRSNDAPLCGQTNVNGKTLNDTSVQPLEKFLTIPVVNQCKKCLKTYNNSKI